MENPIPGQSAEYNDNRISLYVGQNGKCAITKCELEIGQMEAHHKVPRSLCGTDKYDNLLFVTTEVHKLIHATNVETIQYYQQKLGLEEKAIRKVNKLRILAGNCEL
ncbi:MAG TPA: HNH endonuclease [Bacillales bacterium]|nr:HNH endonuclease [Bacillales bacterium]